jgi:signal transduction histidine kinase
VNWECCWDKETLVKGDCPNISDEEANLLVSRGRRILEKCLDCANFKRDLNAFRESGHPLSSAFSLLHGEYQRQKSQIQSLVSFLDSKSLEIRFLHELGSVLQSSVDLEEVLSVALTAITAGRGFGMNRAFLLMTDRERDHLQGYLAIGPRNYEEASQTWDEISRNDMDLQTLAQSFRQNKISAERAKFHDILEQLSVPLADAGHVFIKALDGKHPVLIENAYNHPDVDPELVRLLGVDTFLLMPLNSHNRRVGLIIADNCITHHRITEEDMHSLETFAFPVAFAIERASLYDRLQVELNRVTEASTKLQEQQDLIVRMEKMALVGRITSSVAHSIRNPLMIIGGFARSMLKNTPVNDSKRDFIESIVNEARQLEVVLDEVLNYSDSLYPTVDFWDANQLVETALRDIQGKLFERGYEAGFHPGANVPKVFIDYKQVAYCIRNIILSNIEGMNGGRIDVGTYMDGEHVTIRIEDSGKKISEDELESMLTPFAVTYDIGSDLGLALCHNMLDKLNLPFLVVAPPEGGVSYTIKLPTRKEEPQ